MTSAPLPARRPAIDGEDQQVSSTERRRYLQYVLGNGGALLLGLVVAYVGLLSIGASNTVALGLKTVDLMEYYSVGQLILHGHAGQIYDWVTLGRLQYQLVAPYGPAYGVVAYLYPPFFVTALVPLFTLPYSPVYLIWLAIDCVVLVATLFPLERYMGIAGKRSLLFRLAALTFLPVFLTLGLGQASIVLLALYAGCFFAARSGRDTTAGVLLALACIKPPYVVALAVVFLARRAWRTLGAFAVTGLALMLLPLPIFGSSIYGRYLTMLAQTTKWQGRSIDKPLYYHHYYIPTGTYAPQWNHSLSGLTELLLPGTAATAASMLLRLAVVAVLVVCTRRGRAIDIPFALGIVAALLIAPHALAYDMSLLLIPVAVAVRLRPAAPRSLAVLLAAVYFGIAAGYVLVFHVPIQLSVLLMIALAVWLVAVPRRLDMEGGEETVAGAPGRFL